MTGHIVGGWGYVWAAYAFTGTALATYVVSLAFRFRAEARASQVALEAARLEEQANALAAAEVTP